MLDIVSALFKDVHGDWCLSMPPWCGTWLYFGIRLVLHWLQAYTGDRDIAFLLRTVLNWHCQCGDIQKRISYHCWEYWKLYCYCHIISIVSPTPRHITSWLSIVPVFSQCLFAIGTVQQALHSPAHFQRLIDGIHQRRVGCLFNWLTSSVVTVPKFTFTVSLGGIRGFRFGFGSWEMAHP